SSDRIAIDTSIDGVYIWPLRIPVDDRGVSGCRVPRARRRLPPCRRHTRGGYRGGRPPATAPCRRLCPPPVHRARIEEIRGGARRRRPYQISPSLRDRRPAKRPVSLETSLCGPRPREHGLHGGIDPVSERQRGVFGGGRRPRGSERSA